MWIVYNTALYHRMYVTGHITDHTCTVGRAKGYRRWSGLRRRAECSHEAPCTGARPPVTGGHSRERGSEHPPQRTSPRLRRATLRSPMSPLGATALRAPPGAGPVQIRASKVGRAERALVGIRWRFFGVDSGLGPRPGFAPPGAAPTGPPKTAKTRFPPRRAP